MAAKAFAALALLISSTLMLAADTTTATGWIGDSKCQTKVIWHGPQDEARTRACVNKCLKDGEKPVFVTAAGEVWKIDNPAAVTAFAGDRVKIKATKNASTKTVHVEKIETASK